MTHPATTGQQQWPEPDERMVQEETITLPVQVNGKVRGNIEVAVDVAEEDLRGKVLAMENIQRFLPDSREIRRFILVPGKIVNVVA